MTATAVMDVLEEAKLKVCEAEAWAVRVENVGPGAVGVATARCAQDCIADAMRLLIRAEKEIEEGLYQPP